MEGRFLILVRLFYFYFPSGRLVCVFPTSLFQDAGRLFEIFFKDALCASLLYSLRMLGVPLCYFLQNAFSAALLFSYKNAWSASLLFPYRMLGLPLCNFLIECFACLFAIFLQNAWLASLLFPYRMLCVPLCYFLIEYWVCLGPLAHPSRSARPSPLQHVRRLRRPN